MDLLFFTHLFNGLIMVGLPLLVGIYLTRRFHLGWRLFWIGAATFVLSQVGHLPFNTLVNGLFLNGTLPKPTPAFLRWFNPLFGGLSAGLFEELTRAAVYRWWAKDARSWRRGVLMGAGHEAAESIIFGLLVLYTFIQMAALRGADLTKIVPPAQLALAQQQLATYWGTPWTISLLGGVERILTFPVQIALSVIVLQAFTRRQPIWIALAVLWHAVVDAAAVYFGSLWRAQPNGVFAIEGVIAVFAVLSLLIIFALRRPEPTPTPEYTPPPPPPPAGPVRREDVDENITAEKIDNSRFL